jgi:DNA adenine methylase
MKAFKTYFGGKESAGTYQTIINLIRPTNVFVEPFGGNYTLSRYLDNCTKFINEIDIEVFQKYDKNQKSIAFFNYHYKHFLQKGDYHNWKSNITIYFDPPYPLNSRKNNRKVYKYEFTDNDHKEFLDFVLESNFKCDVLISTYPNDLYKEKLKDWFLVEFYSNTRKGKAKEWLFLNYDPSKIEKLHTFKYYGKNNNERQKLKKVLDNNVNKFINMNPILRNEYYKQITQIFKSL